MANIGYILPITGIDSQEIKVREQMLNDIARSTEVKILPVEYGPKAIESEEDERKAIPGIIDLVKKQGKNFDVIILGCTSDPGIEKIRQMTNKTIIGPGRASLAVAASIFDEFSIITTSKKDIPRIRRFVKNIGLNYQLRSIISADVRVLDITYNSECSLKIFEEKVKTLKSPAVVPACMGFAFLLIKKNVKKIGHIHIINPLNTAIRLAECLTK
jgi:allantoin racemase